MPAGSTSGRAVTLVVTDGDAVLGSLPTFDVETPWWQDTEPIWERHPGLAVLRLLEATPSPGEACGGAVRYLVQPLGTASLPDPRALGPWCGELKDDPNRMPWARPGGPASDLEWAGSKVAVDGAPMQHRTWNLSSIWSVPIGRDRAWLKCVPTFFQHEAPVLEVLSSQRVPRVIAAEQHRILLEPLDGLDGYDATLEQRRALIDELVALQSWSTNRLDELLGRGVPDGRLPALVAASRDLVERRAHRDRRLRSLLEDAPSRMAAIEACGLPDVLVHGDAHAGNARVGPGAGRGIWFDWGDSRIGNPMLDLAVLDRAGAPFADELFAHWTSAWTRAVPGSDPARAWALLRPLAALGAAVVYQAFLDAIESSERVFHEADVPEWLARAGALS